MGAGVAERKDMAIDRTGFPVELTGGDRAHQRVVEAIVAGVITKRGYYDAIPDLVVAVSNLGKIAASDPLDKAKRRHFSMWADAVSAAIRKHDDASTFNLRVNNFDHLLARGMGISLDD